MAGKDIWWSELAESLLCCNSIHFTSIPAYYTCRTPPFKLFFIFLYSHLSSSTPLSMPHPPYPACFCFLYRREYTTFGFTTLPLALFPSMLIPISPHPLLLLLLTSQGSLCTALTISFCSISTSAIPSFSTRCCCYFSHRRAPCTLPSASPTFLLLLFHICLSLSFATSCCCYFLHPQGSLFTAFSFTTLISVFMDNEPAAAIACAVSAAGAYGCLAQVGGKGGAGVRGGGMGWGGAASVCLAQAGGGGGWVRGGGGSRLRLPGTTIGQK